MIFDNLGLPRPNGATDFQDSAALAGIMTVFEWPQKVDLKEYCFGWKYVRHPSEIKYDFSRDQAIPLLAGFFTQGLTSYVAESYITGKDFLSPSVKGHIRRCQGLKSTWFQDLNFKLDLWFSAKFKPLDELNQLFCMLLVHPDQSLLKWYCGMNTQWETAIRNYFCGWRDEAGLAELMIGKIKSKI